MFYVSSLPSEVYFSYHTKGHISFAIKGRQFSVFEQLLGKLNQTWM
jgi:hypothetical protein